MFQPVHAAPEGPFWENLCADLAPALLLWHRESRLTPCALPASSGPTPPHTITMLQTPESAVPASPWMRLRHAHSLQTAA